MNKTWKASLVGALAILGAVGLLATALQPALHSTPPASPAAEGAAAGAGGDASAAAARDAGTVAVGVTRPDCPTATVAGVALPCLGGQPGTAAPAPTVVTVWAWWCGPCREELPLFAQLQAAHPEWHVVGVHADDNAGAGAALLEELGVDLPSYEDATGVFAATHTLPNVVPITLFVHPTGAVTTHAKPYTTLDELEADAAAAL
ncbi:hypothetical protein C1Y63_02265 [Corynebacterium sp. 13CS0277]|uniref:TlpA family protein disulfide reductase n=1 Tax=Corynebacterium sp. 13CS0277 TaxID=2071994 RepID=UPI000D029D52|nr:TlpA disulfide reductase family protein [Corynebacterium sp. 13CS0277]PRQ12156.1 hypothetical protein C1Y63_02265 [Corynebacterium sp. 13CS0277]